MPASKSSWEALYPFTSKFFHTPEAHRLHYIDEGEGHPVVMLHGNPTWSFMFRDLVPAVQKAGFRAIALDHLGCGLSDKPQKWPYQLQGHIDNLEHFIDKELKLEQLDLVLHDWGGGVGMGYAVRHPEKIRRVILMNTAAYLSDDCPKRIFLVRTPFLGAFLVRVLNAFVEAALFMATSRKLPDAVKAGYRHPYRSYRDRIATQRFAQDIPLRESHPSRQCLVDIEKGLTKLKDEQFLLCWGAQDFCFHMGFFDRWKKEFYPNAEAMVFEEASHYLLEDHGDIIIPKLVQFLSK
ncbi:MAG: alpha/beta fold hydrolase [Oligosphaeraceae bacterium]|nr:alpha/beta fold hydrolase [Oligosphaeraceae bacterium]